MIAYSFQTSVILCRIFLGKWVRTLVALAVEVEIFQWKARMRFCITNYCALMRPACAYNNNQWSVIPLPVAGHYTDADGCLCTQEDGPTGDYGRPHGQGRKLTGGGGKKSEEQRYVASQLETSGDTRGIMNERAVLLSAELMMLLNCKATRLLTCAFTVGI